MPSNAAILFNIEVKKAQRDLKLSYSDAWSFVQRTNRPLYALMDGSAQTLSNSVNPKLKARFPIYDWKSPALLSALHAPSEVSESDFDAAMERVPENGDISQATAVLREIAALIQKNTNETYEQSWILARQFYPDVAKTADTNPGKIPTPKQKPYSDSTPSLPQYAKSSLPPWAQMGFDASRKGGK